jgi:CyaY protein
MRSTAGQTSRKLESTERYRPLIENTMSQFLDEPRFLAAVDQVFAAVEAALDAAGPDQDLDLDCARRGPVLEITFEDHSRVILNAQAPLHEIWLASRAGGRHFRCAEDGSWRDTRSSETLETALSDALTLHAGEVVAVPAWRLV